MLQATKPVSSVAATETDLAWFKDLYVWLIGFLRRQVRTILITVVIAVVAGTVYFLTTPTKYTAQTTLVLDLRKVQVLQQQSVLGDFVADSPTVDTQVEVLKSESVARSVIKRLRLTEDAEFTDPAGGLLGLVGKVMGAVAGLFQSDEPSNEEKVIQDVLAVFQSRLTIKRTPVTYVIEISFQSLNRDKAAKIANALTDVYIVSTLEAKYEATRRAGAWLQERVKQLREQATEAERKVVDFKSKNSIVDTGGRLMNEQQLMELNSQLLQARGQTADAESRLQRTSEILRMEIPDATVTDILKNEVVSKLRSQYLEMSNKEAIWSARYGKNHLAAVNLRTQMEELKRSIHEELRRTAESYKSDYQIAKGREEALEKSMAALVSESQGTNQAQIELRDLDSNAQSLRALHDNFLQRYVEAVQQQSFPISEARVITQASPPQKKSWPRLSIVLAIAVVGGSFAGAAVGVLREVSDQGFRSSKQIESALNVDCIAIVPRWTMSGEARSNYRALEVKDRGRPRTIGLKQNVFRAVVDHPFSRYSEAIRGIKFAVDLSPDDQSSSKVIGVTSSLPNEGKSTIAVSLAQLIAHSGARAVLVDCDLRNPSLSASLAPKAEAGFLDVVANYVALPEAIWTDPATNLCFLPTAAHTRSAHTSEVLASVATKRLFERLKGAFDYVIVDLSPLSPVIDVRATFNSIDSYVFVVEWGKSQIELVRHALGTAPVVYDKLVGVVLNKTDVKALSRYESYGANYYQNKHYTRYGYTDE